MHHVAGACTRSGESSPVPERASLGCASDRRPSPTRAGARRRRSRPGSGARRASARARHGPRSSAASHHAHRLEPVLERRPPRRAAAPSGRRGSPTGRRARAGRRRRAGRRPARRRGSRPRARRRRRTRCTRSGITDERELEAAVADGEQQRLALAGDDRHRQVGVLRGELGGGDAAPAERPREAEDGVAEVGDRADRRRQLARDRVGAQRGGRRGADARAARAAGRGRACPPGRRAPRPRR